MSDIPFLSWIKIQSNYSYLSCRTGNLSENIYKKGSNLSRAMALQILLKEVRFSFVMVLNFLNYVINNCTTRAGSIYAAKIIVFSN
jgi:hypothetical protein